MGAFFKSKFTLALVPVLLSASFNDVAIAQDTAPPDDRNAEAQTLQAKAADQMLIVEVSLNSIKKGEFVVYSKQDGDWLLKEEDLKAMEVSPPYGTPVTLENEVFYALKPLGAEIQFDEKRLALDITLAAAKLPKNTIDFLPKHPKTQLRPTDNSAYLNYYALYTGNTLDSRKNFKLSLEPGIRIGELYFHSESAHIFGDQATKNIRYETNLTYDNRDTLQRLVIGDFSTSSGNLGNLKNLGGIGFSKLYRIDPYLIKYPIAGFDGEITNPSNVRILLDNIQLSSTKLPPGQFNLENINYYGGLRNISVVLKDSFGREKIITQPFYFSDQNLQQGLHEYSYNVGLSRKNLGLKSNEYRGWALSAFHHYGLTDWLTVGARGEAEQNRFNVGGSGFLRLNRLGTLSAHYAQAKDEMGSGWAGIVRYGYQDHNFNSQVELSYKTPHYETAQPLASTKASSTQQTKKGLRAVVAYTFPEIGNFSAQYSYLTPYQDILQNQATPNQRLQTVSLGYSRTLFGSLGIQINASQNFGANADKNLFALFTYTFGDNHTAQFIHEQRKDTISNSFQIGNNTPIGEGLAYRVGGAWAGTGNGDLQNLTPSVRYNGPYGNYSMDAQIEHGQNTPIRTTYQLGTSGSLAYVDSSFALSRPVTDSFGIVEVGKLEGVRVYQSSHEIGRTDKNGRIFLANMGSYIDNTISIDDKDIPFDYTLEQKELHVSPPLHSGSVIRFGIKKLHIIQGHLHVKTSGKPQPVEYVDLAITVDNKEQTVPTGKGGEFYLENLSPGQYHAKFDRNGHCEFDLTIPDSKELIIELGDLYVCQLSK